MITHENDCHLEVCRTYCRSSISCIQPVLSCVLQWWHINSSSHGQNGSHVFKCIFLNENIWVSNKISLKYVPWGLIDNMSALVQIMAWRRPGDKPLSEPMLIGTRGRWVNLFDSYLSWLFYWYRGTFMLTPAPVRQNWRVWVKIMQKSAENCWYNHNTTMSRNTWGLS